MTPDNIQIWRRRLETVFCYNLRNPRCRCAACAVLVAAAVKIIPSLFLTFQFRTHQDQPTYRLVCTSALISLAGILPNYHSGNVFSNINLVYNTKCTYVHMYTCSFHVSDVYNNIIIFKTFSKTFHPPCYYEESY